MSTITTNPRSPVAPSAPPFSPAEERGVVRGVSWDFYDRLTSVTTLCPSSSSMAAVATLRPIQAGSYMSEPRR